MADAGADQTAIIDALASLETGAGAVVRARESQIYGVPWFIRLYNSGASSRSAVQICAMLRPIASSNLP